MKTGTYIKIKKIGDSRFYGEHPNGINEGFTAEGKLYQDFQVGASLALMRDNGRFFATSVVQSIEDNKFTTNNSTYEYEIIEND